MTEKNSSKPLFHLICGLTYVGACIADYFIANPKFLPIPNNFFSKFVWLTLIDLYLQTFYHLAGIFVSNSRSSSRVYDTIGHSLVAPVGATVVLLFWALYLFDPDTLLADDNAKAIIAITWFNHGIHTLPVVTPILETLFFKREQPSRGTAVKIIAVFAIIYVAHIHIFQHFTGFWAYPILEFLILPYRIVFIFVCMAVFFVNYSAFSWLNSIVHGKAQKKRN